jgi:hypothetical protein
LALLPVRCDLRHGVSGTPLRSRVSPSRPGAVIEGGASGLRQEQTFAPAQEGDI